MAQSSKVSDLQAGSALSGPELFYSVQSSADRKVTADQIKTFSAFPGNTSWAGAGTNVSITTTAEIQVAAVAVTAKAATKYLVMGFVRMTKDTGTTARAVTLRLRRGTDNTGTLLASAAGASTGIASSPFGASLVFIDTPGAGTPTYRLSVVNSATATTTAAEAVVDVIELGA